jgi:hypothetical protein
MDLSSDDPSQPIDLVKLEPVDDTGKQQSNTVEVLEPALSLDEAERVSVAVIEQHLPEPDEEDPLSMLAGLSSSSYDSFADMRPWLDEWLRSVATPPRLLHVRALESWLEGQLRSQRNLAGVQALLEHLHRWAEGKDMLLFDSDEQRQTAQTWRAAFDHLLRHTQSIVVELFGGQLPFRRFDE